MGRVKVAFISLLVRRERGLAPDTAGEPNHDEEIIHSGQVYGDWEQSIERLKEQWTQFMSETFRAIAEEEMRLRHEELKRRIRSHN
jgi:hypothetical protein